MCKEKWNHYFSHTLPQFHFHMVQRYTWTGERGRGVNTWTWKSHTHIHTHFSPDCCISKTFRPSALVVLYSKLVVMGVNWFSWSTAVTVLTTLLHIQGELTADFLSWCDVVHGNKHFITHSLFWFQVCWASQLWLWLVWKVRRFPSNGTTLRKVLLLTSSSTSTGLTTTRPTTIWSWQNNPTSCWQMDVSLCTTTWLKPMSWSAWTKLPLRTVGLTGAGWMSAPILMISPLYSWPSSQVPCAMLHTHFARCVRVLPRCLL